MTWEEKRRTEREREREKKEAEEEGKTARTERRQWETPPPRQGQTAGVKEERGCGNGQQERKEEQVRSTDEYQEKKRKTREITDVQ